MEIALRTEPYEEQQNNVWPRLGRHILANFDEDSIVVYQAFSTEIADYAVKHGRFGGPSYNLTRMTWVKTNFLWMMYRARWATKRNQERILALHLTREGFEQILRSAKESSSVPGASEKPEGSDKVRMQWDPDHSPSGGKLQRRAVQLGLRGNILSKFHEEWLIQIDDVTDFVIEQYQFVKDNHIEKLVTPRERVFIPSDVRISHHIRLHGFEGPYIEDSDKNATPSQEVDQMSNVSAHEVRCTKLPDDRQLPKEESRGSEVLTQGACCTEMLNECQLTKKSDEHFSESTCASKGGSPCNKHSKKYQDSNKSNNRGLESPDIPLEGACCADLHHESPLLTVTEGTQCQDDVLKSNVCSQDIIICLGGAFNPVHAGHVQVMQKAKRWMEEEMGCNVVAGVLAVASTGFVKAKCKITNQSGIKVDHRIKMCELACRDIDWLKPYRKSTGSAYQAGELVKKEEKLRNARIVVMIGADRAVNKERKTKLHKRQLTVHHGRTGSSADECFTVAGSATVKQSSDDDKLAGQVKKQNPVFVVVPKEMDNLSSTDVREKLRFPVDADDVKKQTSVHELVAMGWIDAHVGEYILQHGQDFYYN